MRFAKRRDGNEREIIAALTAAGATVTQLGDAGTPDLLVGFDGRTLLLEVKDPARRGGGEDSRGGLGLLTEAQRIWWARPWAGDVRAVVESAAEALAAIAAEKSTAPVFATARPAVAAKRGRRHR